MPPRGKLEGGEKTKARLIEQLIERDLPDGAREKLELSKLRDPSPDE